MQYSLEYRIWFNYNQTILSATEILHTCFSFYKITNCYKLFKVQKFSNRVELCQQELFTATFIQPFICGCNQASNFIPVKKKCSYTLELTTGQWISCLIHILTLLNLKGEWKTFKLPTNIIKSTTYSQASHSLRKFSITHLHYLFLWESSTIPKVITLHCIQVNFLTRLL